MNREPQPLPGALPIGAVERDTGLSKDTLRVWERRYGFPQPVRDALGERSYLPEQVEKLRLIKRLLDHGHRPGKIVGLPMDELQRLGAAERVGTPRAQAAPDDFGRYIDLLHADDVAGLRRALNQAQLTLGLEAFVTELVAPLNQTVGEAWMRGDLMVSEEHLYTECVQVVLRQAIGSIPEPPGGAPAVLLATLPQESHGLGLLMAEALFAMHGCRCMSLGVRVPMPDILTTALRSGADIVGLSFTASFNPVQAVEALREMRRTLPDEVELWAGGHLATLQRRLPPGVRAIANVGEIPTLLAARRLASGGGAGT